MGVLVLEPSPEIGHSTFSFTTMIAAALKFILFAGTGCFAAAGLSCSYGALTPMRADAIVSDYEPTLMEGFWYEQAFQDIAQVGSSCQTLNATLDPKSGTLTMPFAVKYGTAPFTIEEVYEVHDPQVKGVYRKSVKAPYGIPGGHLIGLPTVVVAADLSADRSHYETVILYSCVALLNIQEVVIASRSATLTDAKYQAMMENAKARGVPIDGLRRTDHSACSHASTFVV